MDIYSKQERITLTLIKGLLGLFVISIILEFT
jgi:hypothetical protein